jgi:hypothetical protein
MGWDIWMEIFFRKCFFRNGPVLLKNSEKQDEHLRFISVRVIVVSIRTNFVYKQQAYFSLKLRHILFGGYYTARTVAHIIDCQIIN